MAGSGQGGCNPSPHPTRGTWGFGPSSLMLELMQETEQYVRREAKRIIQDLKALKAAGKTFTEEELSVYMLNKWADAFMGPEGFKLNMMVEEVHNAGEMEDEEYGRLFNVENYPDLNRELSKAISDLTCKGSRSPSPTRAAGGKSGLEDAQWDERIDRRKKEEEKQREEWRKRAKIENERRRGMAPGHTQALPQRGFANKQEEAQWDDRIDRRKKEEEKQREEWRKRAKIENERRRGMAPGHTQALPQRGFANKQAALNPNSNRCRSSPQPTRGTAAGNEPIRQKLLSELKQVVDGLNEKNIKYAMEKFKEQKATGQKMPDLAMQVFFYASLLRPEYQQDFEKIVKLGDELNKIGGYDPEQFLYKMSPKQKAEFDKITSEVSASGQPVDPYDYDSLESLLPKTPLDISFPF